MLVCMWQEGTAFPKNSAVIPEFYVRCTLYIAIVVNTHCEMHMGNFDSKLWSVAFMYMHLLLS